jgi:uncharacterized membrane protein
MSDTTKNIWKLIGVVIALVIAYKLVMYSLGLLLKVAIPVLIVGGIVYGVYRLSGGKALTGSGRRTLP